MYPHVKGGEQEFSLRFLTSPLGRGSQYLMSQSEQVKFFSHIPPELYPLNAYNLGATYNFWLKNGARLYLDTGFHAEYATPEALLVRSLVKYEKAGEWLIEYLADKTTETLTMGGTVRAYKDNIDRGATSHGSHENYYILRNPHTTPEALTHSFAPFLVAEQIYTGAGAVFYNPGNPRTLGFRLSQRSPFLVDLLSGATTSARSLINTRDEVHGDGEHYRRLHLITNDADILETAAFLKYGTADIMLDMIEERFLPLQPFGEITKDDILRAKRIISLDTSLTSAVTLGNRTDTAIGFLEWYFEKAQAFGKERGRYAHQEWKFIMKLWENFLSQAKTQKPHEALRRTINWAAKLWLLLKDMEQAKYDWSAPYRPTSEKSTEENEKKWYRAGYRAETLDILFAELSGRGFARKLIAAGEADRILTDEEVEAVRFRPIPKETRAYARSLELDLCEKVGRKHGAIFDLRADWTFVKLSRTDHDTIFYFYQKDPHDWHIPPNSA